jgi:ATP-binding cassette subfamily B protein
MEIRFRQVSFQYPGSDRTALRDLDLAIPAGQVAAIVGTNGAGKSTLVKLLCRFYDPQQGRIELDGIDVRDLALGDLRGAVTVLFQEPVHYNASVAENIALDPDAAVAKRPAIEAAARAAGAEALIEGLPEGYETLLGKWFGGGVELSTGEWQRLALARAFMRPSRLILLDEPTSAMDSWAEADWIRRFRALATGRTAVIVTHRFTTAMQADVIYVMDEGRVSEHGSHEELLRHDGAYAQSWRAQMRAEHGAAVG